MEYRTLTAVAVAILLLISTNASAAAVASSPAEDDLAKRVAAAVDQTDAALWSAGGPGVDDHAMVRATRAEIEAARRLLSRNRGEISAGGVQVSLRALDTASRALMLLERAIAVDPAGLPAARAAAADDVTCDGYDPTETEYTGTAGSLVQMGHELIMGQGNYLEPWLDHVDHQSDTEHWEAALLPEMAKDAIGDVDDAVGGYPEPEDTCSPAASSTAPDADPETPGSTTDMCGPAECPLIKTRRVTLHCYNKTPYAPTRDYTSRYKATAVGVTENECDYYPGHTILRKYKVCLKSRKDNVFGPEPWRTRKCIYPTHGGSTAHTEIVKWYCRGTRDWRVTQDQTIFVDGKRKGSSKAGSPVSTLNC